MTATDQPSAPCPRWCARPSGHDLAPTASGAARRWHVGRQVGDLELQQPETVAADGTVTAGPVTVSSPVGALPVADLAAVLAELAP